MKRRAETIEGKKKSAKAGRTEVRVEGAERNDSFGTAEAVPLTRSRAVVESRTDTPRFICEGTVGLRHEKRHGLPGT
jgi:hypothetical protein